MNTSIIQEDHRQKLAYVYLRQSTLSQVRHNQESTERQYALQDHAQTLGWPSERIVILDGDLGLSGTQMANRPDFKRLVAEVSLQKVGAIFSLEASRLSRSCLDWHRLMDLCGWTGTLLVDEDGCYNPSDFNDRLLLGLKGTMSQAELHFMHARLLGGKLNKARKGELRFPLPVGLVDTQPDGTVLDPDQEVQGAVRMVFESFRQTGSAYGVVRQFSDRQVRFPKRSYGGVWNGQLRWGRLCHGRVLSILRNPAYAGAYVFGRYRGCKSFSPEGQVRSKVAAMPMTDWKVLLKDKHPGYISWEDFLANQQLLAENQTNDTAGVVGAAREGGALLQGLILCGRCGRRMAPRYGGAHGASPAYECNWRRRELAGRGCGSVRADVLDAAVAERVLDVLTPAQLEIALSALAEVEHRDQAVEHQWQMKIQRADYEAQLAQRRFDEVDPANRLVADNLEKRWEHALQQLAHVRQEHEEYRQKQIPPLTADQQRQVRQLAEDLPRLWRAPTTTAKEHKRVLRLLIKDITLEKRSATHQAILHLRWQGGATEDLTVALPLKASDRWRYPDEIVSEVRVRAHDQTDEQIAEAFRKQGRKSAKGGPFTAAMISWIRYKHRIVAALDKRPEELTVRQLSEKFGVSRHVAYYWLDRGVVNGRRRRPGGPIWITLSEENERELAAWVKNSKRICTLSPNNPNPAARGAI
jgi:DNA invertase Pin-like site-specific DNA recombinase